MAHIYFSTGDAYFGKHTLIYSGWITVDYAYVYIFAKITLISFNLCLQIGRKKEICLNIMHISPLPSEPADIFRAALHHRSHYLFILLFRYFIYKFYFSGTDTDQTTILHVTSAEDS